ncbi:MAG TPA: hypothetical protein VKD25_09885 [Burkholderiales bacterium]|nr:hypothetical protein [Burkholderiales bacterium]
MKIRLACSRWLALLLLSGAALVASAPQPAYAHDPHDRTGGSVSQPVDPAAGIAGTAHGWSPTCPGSPGNPCCCGGRTACPGSGKHPIVLGAGWIVAIQSFTRQVVPASPGTALLPLSPPSVVLPRAPPFFS